MRSTFLWISLGVAILGGVLIAGLGAIFGWIVLTGLIDTNPQSEASLVRWAAAFLVLLIGSLPLVLVGHLAWRTGKKRAVNPWIKMLSWTAAILGAVATLRALADSAPDPAIVLAIYLAGLWGYLLTASVPRIRTGP